MICIVADNRNAPWLLWEAGALFGGFGREHCVVPFLIDIEKGDVGAVLNHFQMIEAGDRDEVTLWLKDINKGLWSRTITQDQIDKYVDVFWAELEGELAKAIKEQPVAATDTAGATRTF